MDEKRLLNKKRRNAKFLCTHISPFKKINISFAAEKPDFAFLLFFETENFVEMSQHKGTDLETFEHLSDNHVDNLASFRDTTHVNVIVSEVKTDLTLLCDFGKIKLSNTR